MVVWHQPLNGHEFEQTLGDSEGQGSLVGQGSHLRTVLAISGHPKPEDLSEGFRDSRFHITWQLRGHVHSGASDTVNQRL